MARPIAAAFHFARVQKDEILTRLRGGVSPVSRVKIRDVIDGVFVWFVARAPPDRDDPNLGVDSTRPGSTRLFDELGQ